MTIKLISKQNKKEIPGEGKEMKKKKIILTSRRKKLLLIMKKNSANIGKEGGKGKVKPLEKMIKEAGFSDSVSRQQSEVMKPLREAGLLDGFIDELDEKIKICANAMDKKRIGKQSPYTNALTMDILVKNRQLLTGKSTGIVGVDLTNEQIKKINDRLTKRLGK